MKVLLLLIVACAASDAYPKLDVAAAKETLKEMEELMPIIDETEKLRAMLEGMQQVT